MSYKKLKEKYEMKTKIYKSLALCIGSLLIAATANAYHNSSGVSFGISIGGDDGYRHGRYYDNDYRWYRHHYRHPRHHYDSNFYRHHRDRDHDRRGGRHHGHHDRHDR